MTTQVTAPIVRLALMFVALACAIARAAPAEVRGTWITTTANDAISSPEKTAQTMRRLREIGLNTVYVECWKNGFTEYPSATMQKLIGVPMRVNGKDAIQRDLLSEAVIEAHRNQLLCVAWLEYGFMAAFRDSQHEFRAFARERGWLSLSADGAEVGKINPFVWLNPFHPDVQQFLIDISLEAVTQYDVDGIQLDDRIALPVDMGYDPFTRALYKTETGRDVPDDHQDPHWMQWRADKISAYSLRYVTALREAKPELIISVSPAPYPWSFENYLCDWMKWTKWCYCGGKRWDEYVPQCYRMTGDATVQSIREQIEQIGDAKIDLVAGIRVVGDGPDMPWEGLVQSIEYTREQQIGGHVLWFSRGVLEVYPDQLQSFYDVAKQGHASNPFKPGNWRFAPAVAERQTDGTWRVDVPEGNCYRVIARKKDEHTWQVIETRSFERGGQTLGAIEAEAVELLVDR
jgi:uncharacterized lipoprotein YddW (UPF0748 family)